MYIRPPRRGRTGRWAAAKADLEAECDRRLARFTVQHQEEVEFLKNIEKMSKHQLQEELERTHQIELLERQKEEEYNCFLILDTEYDRFINSTAIDFLFVSDHRGHELFLLRISNK